MKRILALILALLMLLTLSACNSGDGNKPEESGSEVIEKVDNGLTVAQLQLTDGTGGMSYVITLKNEGFIIIDGGMGNNYYSKHSGTLFNYLFKRTTKGENPKILGWFFTHFHNDHVENAAQFLKEYADKVDVSTFYINPAGDDDSTRELDMEALVREGMDANPEADKHYLKTGEKIEFPHCTVDMLLTSANLNSNGDTGPNNLSAVFKMNFDNGKSFLVTGDTDHDRLLQLFNKSSDVYRPIEDLKCDIYQLPHHGRSLATSSDAMRLKTRYEQLTPSVVFVPVAKKNFETDEFYIDKKWPENYYLINSGAQVFHHSETITIDLEDLSFTYN